MIRWSGRRNLSVNRRGSRPSFAAHLSLASHRPRRHFAVAVVVVVVFYFQKRMDGRVSRNSIPQFNPPIGAKSIRLIPPPPPPRARHLLAAIHHPRSYLIQYSKIAFQ